MRLRKVSWAEYISTIQNLLQLGRSRETAESGDRAATRCQDKDLQLGRSRETAESRDDWQIRQRTGDLQLGRSRETAESRETPPRP